jgi:hypothetical protein
MAARLPLPDAIRQSGARSSRSTLATIGKNAGASVSPPQSAEKDDQRHRWPEPRAAAGRRLPVLTSSTDHGVFADRRSAWRSSRSVKLVSSQPTAALSCRRWRRRSMVGCGQL